MGPRENMNDNTDPQKLAAENARLREALIEIRDHWCCQYDHPKKLAIAKYAGPYGIGVTDGHRLCAFIARKALRG